jgi:hypothetical protein
MIIIDEVLREISEGNELEPMPGNEDIVMSLEAENEYYNNINDAELEAAGVQVNANNDNDDDDESVESCINRGENKLPQSMDNASIYTLNPRMIKNSNEQFKYESFLRLRNVFYLCLLLKKNPSLRLYRHHYIEEVKKREKAANRSKVQSKSNFFSERYERLLRKLNFGRSSDSPKHINVNGQVDDDDTTTVRTNDEALDERSGRNVNSGLISNRQVRRVRKTSL